MKKQLRNIIISFCVVVLLAVGIILWINVISPKLSTGSSSSTSSTSSSIQLYKVDSSKITALHVKNSKGEYTIRQKNSIYSVDGLSTSLLSQDNISTAVTTVNDLEATSVIKKNAKDLSIYGLAKPKAVIDITSGGKTFTIYMGNNTPGDDGTYIHLKGSNTVYMVLYTLGSEFIGSKLDFLNLSIYSVDSNSLNKVTRIEFGGSSRKKPIVLEESASTANSTSSGTTPTYNITSPHSYLINDDAASTIIAGLESVSVAGIISMDVSEKNLQKYGLVNPQYTLSVTYDKKKTTFLFGTAFKESGTSYIPLMIEGTPTIYKIDTSTLSFYKYQLTKLTSSLLYMPNIGDIKSVAVTSSAGTYTLNLSGKSSDISGNVNGKKVTEKNIKAFYEHAINIATEGLYSGSKAGKVYAKIVFTYHSSKTAPVTLEFRSINDLNCSYTLSGDTDFYVLKTNVDDVISTIKTLAAGKTVSEP